MLHSDKDTETNMNAVEEAYQKWLKEEPDNKQAQEQYQKFKVNK